MRDYPREKKEEWKEILEETVFEDESEKNLSDDSTLTVESPEVINELTKNDFPETVAIDELQSESVMDEEAIAKKTKKEFRSRLIMIFILGFLIGIAFKTEALKRVTIGYNDYLMKIKSQSYDINQMQIDLTKARETATQMQDGQEASSGEAVSEMDNEDRDNQNIEDGQI